MTGKKFDQSSQTGDEGIALIHTRVLQMQHVWHERRRDAGIDGQIEIRDPSTGEVANRFLYVQSKASNNPFPGESDVAFHYICDERDLDYWMRADNPVILVCSHPADGKAWWAHVQGWFADPARRASRRVDFDKATQMFDNRASGRLSALADPAGRAHTAVMTRRTEALTSSLLPVDIPMTMFSTKIKGSTPKEIGDLVRKVQLRPQAWLYRNDTLYSFRHPSALGLDAVVAAPIREDHPTGYALECVSRHNIVVQMLGQALRVDTSDDLWLDPETKLLCFKAKTPLKTMKQRGPHGRLREVVTVHRNQKKGHINWVRHMALRWRFILDHDEWLLDIAPDYRFTVDGYRPSSMAAELTSKIKRMERHAAVRGQMEFWAHYLRPAPADLLETTARFLTIHDPLTFEVDHGIDDDAWDESRARFKTEAGSQQDALWDVTL
ncbi:DUF4365 domain-containing protein [Kribbella sp. VKM Ac-2566]|uniref:DUF4365 domain-containing protein n=1 Tax=Kribbella sp. VKM Ac-2566 TaxID=2512218 RepID=UPI001063B65A|nr:DUF4365 domain-containing protein [Kribbella sp. VKM Ac-2566]TDX04035.1 uncharacterized protein DUF4365 [Kribbella sp. VKM Ac-2566]